MSDAASTKTAYIKVCEEEQKEPNLEILAVLDAAAEDLFDEPEYELRLHANKRNERNEKYRKKLTDEDANVLYKTLKPNMFVSGLDLAYNSIGDEGAKLFGQLLKETLVLQKLVLSYNDIGPDGGDAIAKGLQVNETLRILKLSGNKIGNKGAMAVAGALQVNCVLEELDLAEIDLKTESMIAIATVLNYNTALCSLNLNRPLLTSNQVFQDLYKPYNKVFLQVAAWLLRRVLHICVTFYSAKVDSAFHPPKEETTVHIAKMLKVNSQLLELHLRHCDIRDFGAERLTENMIYNTRLTHLDISRNRIARDGAEQLAILLKKNANLEILNLAYNRIEDDGAVAIANSLTGHNTTLTTLVIRGNCIGSKGLCAVAKAMMCNVTLTGVYIWGNKLEEPACKAFRNLIHSPVTRLSSKCTDVEPYVVDGHVYLAELSCPY